MRWSPSKALNCKTLRRLREEARARFVLYNEGTCIKIVERDRFCVFHDINYKKRTMHETVMLLQYKRREYIKKEVIRLRIDHKIKGFLKNDRQYV